jgi:hypothetical protein
VGVRADGKEWSGEFYVLVVWVFEIRFPHPGPRPAKLRGEGIGGRWVVFDLGGFIRVGEVTARVDARPPPFLRFGGQGPPLQG